MFEKFTQRARQVVVFAQEEARSLKHNYIGTEHILLGLLREQEGLAAHVLESFGVTLEEVRAGVTAIVGAGEEATSGQIPFTPRAKKVLELALREALTYAHNYIGTEHLLLGLIRENEGVAVRILLGLDVETEQIRAETVRRLGPRDEPFHEPTTMRRPAPPPRERPAVAWPAAGWLAGLEQTLDQLAEEIRAELGREPDPGDLVLVLACLPDTLPGAALRELGVDLDALAETIASRRREQATARGADSLGAIRRRLGLVD